MKFLVKNILITLLLIMNYRSIAQSSKTTNLSTQDQALVQIAALTAVGDLEKLETALADGLQADLTINQINDLLAQLYAYCGFPRSLNAIQTFMHVVEQRKQSGILDINGRVATRVADTNRYEIGRSTLETLTGKEQQKPAPGFGVFNPTIDRFLKEHLFADVFSSDLLTHKQREIATISALAMIQGAEPQLQAHFGIGSQVGISKAEMLAIVETVSSLLDDSPCTDKRPAIELIKFYISDSEIINQEVSKKHLIRISEIEVNPDYLEEYLTILKDDSAASVKKEAGVISIFPLVQKENPSQIRILEFYQDREAYKTHIASPHFQHYKTATLHMVKDLKLIDMYVIDAESMTEIFEKLK